MRASRESSGLLATFEIDHPDFLALVEPKTALWAIVSRGEAASLLEEGRLARAFAENADRFSAEMDRLRFGIAPAAVYFNPTARCNADCPYCYLPSTLRQRGPQMPVKKVLDALEKLTGYFRRTLPKSARPEIIFHGAEPLMNREAVIAAIREFDGVFRFGIQTNGTLLDEKTIAFLAHHGVNVGLSLDGATAAVSDRTRRLRGGGGMHRAVVSAMERLAGYDRWCVISTVTRRNVRGLVCFVEFLHEHRAPACMLNMVRCTMPSAPPLKPADRTAARHYIAALERTFALYRETGRKLVVANFANILIAILAPTARRLMCDISPCGGGRCFFALASDGEVFPCSEFVGFPEFSGGNIFSRSIEEILASPSFERVTTRSVDEIAACRDCPIRHWCGAPCPAEAHGMRAAMNEPGAFCAFYKEQARYAFRLIAENRVDDFLWEGWDRGTISSFEFAS